MFFEIATVCKENIVCNGGDKMIGNLREAVIVAYGRSAVAKSGKKGYLRDIHPVDYAGTVLKGVLEKIPQLNKIDIEDVIVGCSKPERVQGACTGRIIAVRAGLPYNVPGQTVSRLCASGLQAISTAANMIATGQSDILVAGGMESMSAIPAGYDPLVVNQWIQENEPGIYMSMGLTAEKVAEQYGVTREEMDAFALESHRRAAAAQDAGVFESEIIPVEGTDLEGNKIIFNKDQGIRRDTSMEKLAGLKTIFKEDGKVTAGQSSQTSDGTGFVVLMAKEKAEELGIKPIAKFIAYAVSGVDPSIMGIGPIKAVPKVMKIAGLKIEDMDVIELNEAFAAQAIPCIKVLGFDKAKVNPNGGAIAMGHPLGATGAVLTCKALNQLERTKGKYALVTMCIGGGQGAAGIFEMMS